MKEMALPQIVTIGIYNSNVAVRNKTITKNRETTMFEIEMPMEKGGISYVDSEQFPIDENMIICSKPGQIRHTKLPFKCYYVKMILNEGYLYDILMNIPSFLPITKIQEYKEIFKVLCKYQETGTEADIIILHSLILKLVYMLNKDSKKTVICRKIKKHQL